MTVYAHGCETLAAVQAYHARIKENADVWSSLPLHGVQDVPSIGHGVKGGYSIELRNCSCGTTLGRKVARIPR